MSFNEAKSQLEDFNKCVVDGGQNLEDYFKGTNAGNTVLKKYVSETKQQEQSTQGLIAASKAAREAQIAHNLAIKKATIEYKAATLADLKTKALSVNMKTLFTIE